MASRFEEVAQVPKECANCGATDDLLRCSRCRTEWFCSLACHKVYWPFHRDSCKRNEFADALEESDSRFAAWLRRHGKQAILGDAEVDRLERASRAVSGPGREDVMHSMYGKLDPKPEGANSIITSYTIHSCTLHMQIYNMLAFAFFEWEGINSVANMPGNRSLVQDERTDMVYLGNPVGNGGLVNKLRTGPKYSLDEKLRVQERERQEAMKTQLMNRQDAAWSGIAIDPDMGMECARYKWIQNQSHVYIFVRMPDRVEAGQLCMQLRPGWLSVSVGQDDQPILYGSLYGSIKAEHSTWFVDDGILHIQLLKVCRRGHYVPGTTNADTWWRSLWSHCPPSETLERRHPPTKYYWSEYEEDDLLPLSLPAVSRYS